MPDNQWLPLSRLPLLDPSSGEVTAVIETPKGSPNKYDYDAGCAAFRLTGVMPEGTTFPYDFGFVPSTVAEDGDPLDVLVRDLRPSRLDVGQHVHAVVAEVGGERIVDPAVA